MEDEAVKLNIIELNEVVKNLHNWKHPGVDPMQNFWYKQFTTLPQLLADQVTRVISGESEIPQFLTQGITFLKPESKNTQDPS